VFVNAIQHTHKRETRYALTPIQLDVTETNEWLHIVIRDHGCGFNDGVLRFLNDPDSVGSADIGLGLFFLKLTIALTGGKLTAGNVPHQGGGWVEMQLPLSKG
jgi:signal transduction histidine kinase